jgi:glycosyltransferase involved in cell wall biosynthesis/2-polyprenyl-3-methyl-5-hydroxy-6-metoxy-1,4-benzoquinol methylase
MESNFMSCLSTEGRPVKLCHVCKGVRIYYLFSACGHRVVRCDDCGLAFLNPQPSDDELARIYDANYFLGSDSEAGSEAASELKQATAGLYLSEIRRYHGLEAGRLLEVGCGKGHFLVSAEADGWQVTGVEFSPTACKIAQQQLQNGNVSCGELQQAGLASEQFDLCVVSDVIEHVRSPLDFLREIHRVLKPGGTLFIATPSIDSWSARFLRQKWMEFKAEHLTYFDRQTIQTALFKSGFRDVIVQPGLKILNFDYVKKHFDRFPVPMITPALNFGARILPKGMQLRHRRVVASGIMVFSRKSELRSQPVLSVIVPAYNEAKTFGALMEALLRKETAGLRMEIIVVESNSTDGTREAALKYEGHPKVKLILEEQPHGKGHAVREGFKAASGDYVLIQDADLEYDLEDYDALLEQLVAGRCAFVLGSRHGGRKVMKMRQFTGQHGLSLFFNAGHLFFTTLINVLFLQRLRDPFTMFKVFRRDCLSGLEFECNRFDFDFELLVKLIRKGYRPVELPVNYRSRSFKDGKKVRMFRDPLNWLATVIRLRWGKIDPMKVIERKRGADRPGMGAEAKKAIRLQS